MQEFYSNGKLLLTGEYVVLDGVTALAVPTKYGQSLTVENIEEQKLIWESYNHKNELWFNVEFDLLQPSTEWHATNDISKRLIQILNAVKQLNPEFLNNKHGFKVETHLDFPNNWGLGTSSTLINNIAQWAKIDPFKLLELTFGGSGYDIACAKHNTAITFTLKDKKSIIKPIIFNPDFKSFLYFVHLNQKQNSRDGIKHYRKEKKNSIFEIDFINNVTQKIIACNNFDDFVELIELHETFIAKITNQVPVKNKLFSDFNGAIKSLGAWGGDFVLVASRDNPTDYFDQNNYSTVLSYKDIVL
ncbi:GHMP kinase [Tamlana sedimentorum]|uniref:GHMP kinase n=1 Tax=Neotamlana sedimentorum TaxID=1435349 RepID=A0A0D7WB50_9FLAO|nr:GYDIA family GHMP kinase [Tamlana sedimentorum]KJD36341.1 GHMP kinase [Tamlana sedimentorum]